MHLRRVTASDNRAIETLLTICRLTTVVHRHDGDRGIIAEAFKPSGVRNVGCLLYLPQVKAVQLTCLCVVQSYENLGVAREIFNVFISTLPTEIAYVRALARQNSGDERLLEKLGFKMREFTLHSECGMKLRPYVLNL